MGQIDRQATTSDFIESLRMIQEIIKRMAFNSFLIKGWAITLVAVTMLVNGNFTKIWIAFIPIIFFWSLDAYYLRQERLFRALYRWIVENKPEDLGDLFSLDTSKYKNSVSGFIRVSFSGTLLLFYGMLIIMTLIVNWYKACPPQTGG